MVNEKLNSGEIDHMCVDFHKFDIKEKSLSYISECYDRDEIFKNSTSDEIEEIDEERIQFV